MTLLMALIATLPALAGDDAGGFPYEVHHQVLDNGLDVYVVPTGAEDVVAVATWFAVGSRDEVEPGRTGFAHFFEHLMFHGTEALPRDERESLLVRLGADTNAWTWMDETVYHAVLAPESLDRFLDSEADRFANLTLTPDGVRRESGAVYGEFRKGQADPGERLGVAVRAEAFTTHTYGHDTIGLEQDIQAMPEQYDAAVAFLDRFYRPQHADLVLVGDIQPDEAFVLAAQAFNGWERGDLERPEVPAEPDQDELREVSVTWPGATAPRLLLAWKAPAGAPGDVDVAALDLVQELLLGSVGPLERRLVREEGLAYGVQGGREDFVDPGLFTVSVVAKEAEHLDRIEAIVREELEALAQGVDPDRLDRTRTHVRYAWLTSLDDPMTVAQTLGWSLRRSGSPEGPDRWLGALDAVTPSDLTRVTEEVFTDTRLTRGVLTPAPPSADDEVQP